MAGPLGSNLGPGNQFVVKLPKPTSATKLNLLSKGSSSFPSFSGAKFKGGTSVSKTIPNITGSKSSSSLFSSSNSKLGLGGSGSGLFSDLHISKSMINAEQMAHLQSLKGQHSSSGWDSVLHAASGATGILGGIINTIERPYHALTGAADAASTGGSISKGFMQGIEGKTHHTYIAALSHLFPRAFSGKDGTLAKIAAYGLGGAADLALDPANLIGGAGVLGKLGKGAELATQAEKAGLFAKALTSFGIHFGAQESTKAFKVATAATHYGQAAKQAAADVSKLGLSDAELAATAHTLTPNYLNEMATHALRAEHPTYLGVRLGVRKYRVTLRTPLKIGRTLAERQKWADNSFIGKQYASLRGLFSDKYLHPLEHAQEMFVQHTSSQMTQNAFHAAEHALSEYMSPKGSSHLDQAAQEKALMAYEGKAAGMKGPMKDFVLNHEQLGTNLAAAGVKGDALNKAHGFVSAWHDFVTGMRHADQQAHVAYKVAADSTHGYIPHIMQKEATLKPSTFFKSALTKQGYSEFGQKVPYFQQLAIRDAGKAAGENLKNVIHAPSDLIAHRIAAGARAHIAGAMAEGMRHIPGVVPETIRGAVDTAAHAPAQRLVDKIAGHNATINKSYARSFTKKMTAGRRRASDLAKIAALRDATHAKIADVTKAISEHDALAQTEKLPQTERATLHKQLYGHQNQLEKLSAREAAAHARYTDSMTKAALGHQQVIDTANKAITPLEKRLTAMAPKLAKTQWLKNPEAKAAGLVKVDGLKVHHQLTDAAGNLLGEAHTQHYLVPAEIAPGVENVVRVLNSPEAENAIAADIRKMVGFWKQAMTSANPGYAIRNTITESWNTFATGVPMHALTKFSTVDALRLIKNHHTGADKIAKGLTNTMTKAEINAVREWNHMASLGVLSGFTRGDLRMKAAEHLELKQNRNPLTGYNKFMLNRNVERENATRIGHYLYRRSTGLSPEESARWVRLANFDYRDLSKFEQSKMKMIFPFYTWTRKSVPLQIRMMIEQPGHMMAYPKLAQDSEQYSGAKPTDIIGSALAWHPAAFKFGGGYIEPSTGYTDLLKAMDPSKELGMLSPAIKVPIELATGHSLDTGQGLWGPDATHQNTPAPSWMQAIAGLIDQGGRTQRLVGGQELGGPGVSNQFAYAMQQVPGLSFLMSQNPIADKQKGTTPLGVNPRQLSYLFGTPYTNVDPKNEAIIAQLTDTKAWQSHMKQLRDLGLLPNPVHKQSNSAFSQEYQKLIQQMIQRGR